MRPLSSLIAVLLCGALTWAQNASELVPSERPPLHDPEAYETLGPVEVKRNPDLTLPVEKIGKMREWLWEHWSGRRTSLLIEIRYSYEGDRISSFWYIERNEQGRWRLAVKYERLLVNRQHPDPNCERFKEDFHAFYDVVRTELQLDKNGNSKVIPEGEARAGSKYLLSLRDANGKELTVF